VGEELFHPLDFPLHTEAVDGYRWGAVDRELLVAVTMVVEGQHAVVEAHRFGRRPDVPLADGGGPVAGGPQRFRESRSR